MACTDNTLQADEPHRKTTAQDSCTPASNVVLQGTRRMITGACLIMSPLYSTYGDGSSNLS
jgi:hypothetical protein